LNWEGIDSVVGGSYLLTCPLSLLVMKAFCISYSRFLGLLAINAVCGLDVLASILWGYIFSKFIMFYVCLSVSMLVGLRLPIYICFLIILADSALLLSSLLVLPLLWAHMAPNWANSTSSLIFRSL
jgi:hypothetical protein